MPAGWTLRLSDAGRKFPGREMRSLALSRLEAASISRARYCVAEAQGLRRHGTWNSEGIQFSVADCRLPQLGGSGGEHSSVTRGGADCGSQAVGVWKRPGPGASVKSQTLRALRREAVLIAGIDKLMVVIGSVREVGVGDGNAGQERRKTQESCGDRHRIRIQLAENGH